MIDCSRIRRSIASRSGSPRQQILLADETRQTSAAASVRQGSLRRFVTGASSSGNSDSM